MKTSFKIIIASLFFVQCLSAQLDFSSPNTEQPALLKEMSSKVENGDYENITSILIAQNGELIFEKYYNGNNESSLHNTRSATKTMATFLTGIAKDQGLISETDKIFNYLAHKNQVKNPDSRKDNIIIEDLLTMSCMLETDDSNYFSRGHEERMYFIEDWTQFLIDLPIRSYPFNPKPAEQPYGRFFHYSSAQASAMSEILQTAINEPLHKFAKKHLFNPLEISEYKLDFTPTGYLNTAGGSNYRSQDLLKFIQLCLNDGVWNGKQLISKEWIKLATSPKANARSGVDYGYFLWLEAFGKDKKHNSFYMSGNGGNRMHAFKDLNATIVVTTTNYGNRNAHSYIDEILNEYIVPVLSSMKD
ncbi:serine hydrolase domain-containing protein [Croceitalea vernalis]|uniref:Serine hydrolase domain-containing protein n=1 Tax=Croceitalea vernalis TaxID=3075599 RepID=A0ABU3BDH7_9FLAO|nr:serine hydrolase domain-containing protein [Croceitalea sp. P007]MDT0620283.1 serine hydrolase domain-containing protein [Croceitalea sp. P007]